MREQRREIIYYSEKSSDFSKKDTKIEGKYKSKRFNSQRLGTLAIAFSHGLFPKPKKGQLFYELDEDFNCTLFFLNEYYSKLKEAIDIAYENGKFAQSNAESDWNDLKYAIDKAEISDKSDIESLQIYTLSY